MHSPPSSTYAPLSWFQETSLLERDGAGPFGNLVISVVLAIHKLCLMHNCKPWTSDMAQPLTCFPSPCTLNLNQWDCHVGAARSQWEDTLGFRGQLELNSS
ncbi:hypothetical protein COLO4_06551 [Corchorus olitorius]|uniref:Uncharacterized protein n=1 Tax=Corchorus olitorius TaxID=93759 RepID=A0A1R3KMQ4_9ROSI|nr:hypothetical protein COLO4_06551 [Corchorus olitorius]